jgi:hypothetical protein
MLMTGQCGIADLNKGRHTIVGLDASQIPLPSHMLAVDLAQIGYEEGVFIANFAGVMIDCLNTGLEGLPNQLLRLRSAMTDVVTEVVVDTLKCLVR